MQIFQESRRCFLTAVNIGNYILQWCQFIQQLWYWTVAVFCIWWQIGRCSKFRIFFFLYISDFFVACDCSIFMLSSSIILPEAGWPTFCNCWKSNSTLLEFVIGLLWQLQDVQHMQDKDRPKLELEFFLGIAFFQLCCHRYSALACCILLPS